MEGGSSMGEQEDLSKYCIFCSVMYWNLHKKKYIPSSLITQLLPSLPSNHASHATALAPYTPSPEPQSKR